MAIATERTRTAPGINPLAALVATETGWLFVAVALAGGVATAAMVWSKIGVVV